jgi:hypothetical protein
MERIPLALLLRTDRRGPGDIERTVEAAARLGLEITGQGGSVSFRGKWCKCQADAYRKLYQAAEIRSRSAATR